MKYIIFIVIFPLALFAQKQKPFTLIPDPFPFDISCDSGKVAFTINAGVCHRFNTCNIFKTHSDSLVFLYKTHIFEKHTVTFISTSDTMQSYGLYLESIHSNEPGRFYYRHLICPVQKESFPLTIRSQNDTVWYECKDQTQTNEIWRSLPAGIYLIYFKNALPQIKEKVK
jgi:hypothetical protein